ncbi:MAG: hypothetical protein OEZ01_13760 [Candidatus Heimdallarchaeota archaeon]|nr:hypothetical protein [Candidatus Heimdallarchaeota archaeon]MDH5647073.1 hypothetical protein [Candidatus Heimdallarchaeota archaeon]
MKNILTYRCKICSEEYHLNLKEISPIEAPTVNTSNSALIPAPRMKVKHNIYYQNHDTHTMQLELNENYEITTTKKINKIQTILDTLVRSNYDVSKIVNSILENTENPLKPLILFISDLQTYRSFFSSLIKTYIQETQEICFTFKSNVLSTEHRNLKFIITTLEGGMQSLKSPDKIKLCDNRYSKLIPKSIVFDLVSSENENEFINQLKKGKIKLPDDVKVIVAFDTRKSKNPPLAIRSFLLDEIGLKHVDLLNYQDTNGLKSVILQSYYNILDNPNEGRDVYELIDSYL